MVTNGKTTNFILYLFIFHASGNTDKTQDQTTSKVNTLFDDADDLQKQLENEAKDRMKYGQNLFKCKKTTPMLSTTILDQDMWYKSFPDCGGRSQSPVDLPFSGLIKARGARKLFFGNYDTKPKSLTLFNDGRKVMLHGEWNDKHRPLVYGGGAHSRRYIFHSLTLHWPSEHTIGKLQYPLESQALHVSAEYRTLDEALLASRRDPMAFLGIVNLYKFSNHTHEGLKDLLMMASKGSSSHPVPPNPLSYFNPPFKEYACYHGSLTTPPCKESVLWFVRARALTVDRNTMEAAHHVLSPENSLRKFSFRHPQPLNDRKIFFFN